MCTYSIWYVIQNTLYWKSIKWRNAYTIQSYGYDSLQIGLLIWVNRVNTKMFIEWMRLTSNSVKRSEYVIASVCKYNCRATVKRRRLRKRKRKVSQRKECACVSTCITIFYRADIKLRIAYWFSLLLNMGKSNDLWVYDWIFHENQNTHWFYRWLQHRNRKLENIHNNNSTTTTATIISTWHFHDDDDDWKAVKSLIITEKIILFFCCLVVDKFTRAWVFVFVVVIHRQNLFRI